MTKRNLTREDVQTLAERVRPYLTEKRYAHTLSVAKEAVRLGKIYLPGETMRLAAAGLLHDITKKADLKKQLQYCAEFGIMVGNDDRLSPSVFHAKTGAALAGQVFSDVTDEEILAGIRWHTTGHADMTVFESLIYLADYIEETRDFDDCVKVRRFFYDRIEAGQDTQTVLTDTMIYSLDLTIELLVQEGAVIDTDTIRARNAFLAQRKQAAQTDGR